MSIVWTAAGNAADTRKQHRVVMQIDQNDPAVMNLVLNNASNVAEHYRGLNEDVELDIVAYGPGLHMLREDTSPVKDRIRRLTEDMFPAKVVFSACNNTKEGMEKREGRTIVIVPQAALVPSGVVHIMERQEEGWSYVRP
ncbi:MAG TPA: hypothetical protein VH678_08540 [Xanthobacteraceae bacterium]